MSTTQSDRTAARRILSLMEAAGETQVSLSEKTGIPRVTLQRRLAGNSSWPLNELDRIAKAFSTTADELIKEAAA